MPRPIALDADAPAASLLAARPDLSESAAARELDVSRQRVRAMRGAGQAIEWATLARLAGVLFPGKRLEIRLVEEK